MNAFKDTFKVYVLCCSKYIHVYFSTINVVIFSAYFLLHICIRMNSSKPIDFGRRCETKGSKYFYEALFVFLASLFLALILLPISLGLGWILPQTWLRCYSCTSHRVGLPFVICLNICICTEVENHHHRRRQHRQENTTGDCCCLEAADRRD